MERLRKAIRSLTVRILVMGLAAVLLWTQAGEIYIVHTNSMYPHVKDGALIITWKGGELSRNDAVLYEVFDYREVGRIVGVPGDVIDISDNGLFTVNEMAPYENVFYPTSSAEGSRVKYPYKLRPGEYFILNDMRETKEDSRIYGSINESEILGRIVFLAEYRGI